MPPENTKFMVAGYVVASVIYLAYFGWLVRRVRGK